MRGARDGALEGPGARAEIGTLHQAPAARPKKRKTVVLSRTLVWWPYDNGRLRAAKVLGARLEVEFDGYGLTVTAVLP